MSQTTMEFQYLMLNNIYRRAEEERKQPTPPDLSKFDDYFIKEAMKLWKMGKDDAILTFISNERCLSFVADNSYRLIARGTYEKCLLPAYIRTRTNHSHWYKRDLEIFFMRANKQKLLRAGDKLPDTNEFILYRGVSGIGKKRRIRGVSWTSDFDKAKWFAHRYAEFFPNPAVYSVTAKRNQILAYCNERNENEFIIIPKSHMKIHQVS